MNYEVAPFPLNNPLTPTTLEVACVSAKALHAVYDKKTQANFKIYYQAYHASKFSGKMKNLNSVDFQGDCIKAHKFKRNFSAQNIRHQKSINLLGCKV